MHCIFHDANTPVDCDARILTLLSPCVFVKVSLMSASLGLMWQGFTIATVCAELLVCLMIISPFIKAKRRLFKANLAAMHFPAGMVENVAKLRAAPPRKPNSTETLVLMLAGPSGHLDHRAFSLDNLDKGTQKYGSDKGKGWGSVGWSSYNTACRTGYSSSTLFLPILSQFILSN